MKFVPPDVRFIAKMLTALPWTLKLYLRNLLLRGERGRPDRGEEREEERKIRRKREKGGREGGRGREKCEAARYS